MRDSILGFHVEKGVVVFGDVAVTVALADTDSDVDVEYVGVAVTIEGKDDDDDNDAEENPLQKFAKRPTQQERKNRWSIRFAVDIVMTIVELENF